MPLKHYIYVLPLMIPLLCFGQGTRIIDTVGWYPNDNVLIEGNWTTKSNEGTTTEYTDDGAIKDSIERTSAFSQAWKNDHQGINGYREKCITFNEENLLFLVNGMNLQGYTKAAIYDLLGTPDSCSNYSLISGHGYFGSKTELTRQTLTYVVHLNTN